MGGIHLLTLGSAGGVLAPVGLIVPYTGASAPTNWSMFTAANGRLIVGAGSTYAVTTTGGSSSFTASATLSTTGGHNPNTGSAAFANGYSAGCARPAYSSYTGGSHSHTISGSVSAADVYKTFTLIKCTTASKIPANGILLAASNLAGLTNVETTTDRFLYANSAYGTTGGSSSYSGSITTSSNGDHNHVDYGQPNLVYNACSESPSEGNGTVYGATTGAHTHSTSITGNLNTKRMYLSAWSNAAAAYDIAMGGIAMYEGATAPAGWALCNGAGGTPDLRDFFVRIGTTANHGTTSGNNSTSWSGSASSSPSHNHYSCQSGAYCNYGSNPHGSYAWSHTHTASGSATVVQPYYALSFIKYTG